MAANTNSTAAAAAAKARARLEYLLDTSYSKIEELRQLLIKESSLQWKDCTREIDPILNRQRSLHETVIKRLNEAGGLEDKANRLSGKPGTGKGTFSGHANMQQEKIRHSLTATQTQKSLPHSYSMPSMELSRSGKDTVRLKEMPIFDSIHELRSENQVHFARASAHYPEEKIVQTKDERQSQWYGSLDRNMVRKKKRGPMDKSRRHTKILGSMATLERTDELQPDEQYKIGLPNLTRLDTAPNYDPTQRKLPASPPPSMSRYDYSPPPPLPPPKTKASIGRNVPKMFAESSANVAQFTNTKPVSHAPPSVPVERVDRVPSSAWLETNLDESTFMPLNCIVESLPATTVTLNKEYLDMLDPLARPPMASPATDSSEKSNRSSEGNDLRIFLNETIKPFEMADYYKYSTKYRRVQNVNQVEVVTTTDITNGNVMLAGNENESPPDPSLLVPKLPPRDPTNAKSTYKPSPTTSYSDGTQMAPVNSIADTDLGWVMDTPTFV